METNPSYQMKSILIALFLACCCLAPPIQAVEQPMQVSVDEVEDRDFIQGLFKDRKYQFAAEEAENYLRKRPRGFFTDEMFFILAQIHEARGEDSRAEKKYEKILSDYPTSEYLEDTYFYLALLKIRMGKVGEGETYINELKERYPQSKHLEQSHFAQGQIAYAQKNWPRAIQAFEKAYRDEQLKQKIRLQALLLLSWSHNFSGNFERAEGQFKKLLKSKVGQAQKAKIAFQMGIIQLKRDRFKKGRAWFINQKSKWPDPIYDRMSTFWFAESVYLAEQKDSTLFSQWDKQEAIKAYGENIQSKIPFEPEQSLLHRGWLRLALKDAKGAQEDFKILQERKEEYRQDENLSLLRGNLYFQAGDYRSSNRMYKQVLQSKGLYDRHEVNFFIVQNYFLLKECEEVVERSKVVTKLNDPIQKEQNDYYTGVCSQKQKDCKRALWHFREISLDSPNGKKAFLPALACYEEQKRYKEATIWIEKGLKLGGLADKEKLLRKKAQLHIKLAEWPQAIQNLDQLIKADPKAQLNPWVFLELGKSHDQLSDPKVNRRFDSKRVQQPEQHEQLALHAYEKASENLGSAQVSTQLSILEIRRKRYQERKEYEQVLVLYQRALPLIQSPKKKDQLILEIARFELHQRGNKGEAKKWLRKLHGMTAREANFEASLLLAELEIDGKNAKGAAKLLAEIQGDLTPGREHFFRVKFRLGEIYQSLELWDKALRQYSAIAKSKGEHSLKTKAKLNEKTLTKYLKQKRP